MADRLYGFADRIEKQACLYRDGGAEGRPDLEQIRHAIRDRDLRPERPENDQ